MPEYKGEPLDAERGPGLGCFWIQIALLTFFLVFTPLTVTWGWPPLVSAALLIFTLILLLFSGQTIIFLLRLVAADRRTRRAASHRPAAPVILSNLLVRDGWIPGFRPEIQFAFLYRIQEQVGGFHRFRVNVPGACPHKSKE